MQFIQNGPDIPNALLQAHEEGNVIFFCGAGISYPAKLPGFKGLVDKIFSSVSATLSEIEEKAYNAYQYDATLDLLERRLGQRAQVRRALAKALKPKVRAKGALDTHIALLQLATSSDGAVRLVTTNFDQLFDVAARKIKRKIPSYAAPMLPVPKRSRWNGVVYLHGRITDPLSDSELNKLVVTSGDFGLSYLTERWAARFVSELFRNYVVCFVGYSINDPVLRYMMDALAADKLQGETTLESYALVECEPKNEIAKTIEWKAKGVIPVLYEVPHNSDDHSKLHLTLKAWGEMFQDGTLGRERLITTYALTRPSGSTRQDDYVGRMLWALSHQSGLPAQHFADLNPVPPLEWLEPMSDANFSYEDLGRFRVIPAPEKDENLKFSLIRRPYDYRIGPWHSLLWRDGPGAWDEVTHQIARWLMRHLNDPELLIRVCQSGRSLSPQFSRLIEQTLDHQDSLYAKGDQDRLAEIRRSAPNAIPGSAMRTLWRFVLSGFMQRDDFHDNIYRWRDRSAQDGLTLSVRYELRRLLSPKIRIGRRFHIDGADASPGIEEPRILDLVDCEIVLRADHVFSFIKDSRDGVNLYSPELLSDYVSSLADTLALQCAVGLGSDTEDRSMWDMPSIKEHWQNREFHAWTALITMVRNTWHSTCDVDPQLAARVAIDWFERPHPTFKRLALYAASQSEEISSVAWVEWLTRNDAWWLWSPATMREVMRLFVEKGRSLTPHEQRALERSILRGPPRRMYRDELDSSEWKRIAGRSRILRLAKLQAGGVTLGDAAHRELTRLSKSFGFSGPAENERDEFSFWMSGSGDPGFVNVRRVSVAPEGQEELITWLRQPPDQDMYGLEDNWREIAKNRMLRAIHALLKLASQGHRPVSRWSDALHVWTEGAKAHRAWHWVRHAIMQFPDETVKELSHPIAWWLETISESPMEDRATFVALCSRVALLKLEYDGDRDDPLNSAINHPVGLVTRALINVCFHDQPNDGDRLPESIARVFTSLCNATPASAQINGVIILANNLIPLYRVDPEWSESALLRWFDWSADSEAAAAAWSGFLWSPRLYLPLLQRLKLQLLATAEHYDELRDRENQYSAFLTYAALAKLDGFNDQEYSKAVAALPHQGLSEVARALVSAIEGAGDKREEYWSSRVHPFWNNVWPHNLALRTSSISDSLCRVAIQARGEFSSAVDTFFEWLLPDNETGYTLYLLKESKLAEQYPRSTLKFLDRIVQNVSWFVDDLKEILLMISNHDSALVSDPRFVRLVGLLRLLGRWP